MNATNAIETRFVSVFTAVCVAVVIFQFSLPSTPTVFVDTFARPVSWLVVFGWHRLPGVTQWHMMPANHVQSRGRLRLRAPIWVVP